MSRIRVVPTNTGDLIIMDDMPSNATPELLEDWYIGRQGLIDAGYAVLRFDYPIDVVEA